ncbi:TPA: hypothetical protein DEP21_01720 [Patescibacteria group bacterium]|nr:hypothetical protein [Candidatus Gracilibacteria bacterium]
MMECKPDEEAQCYYRFRDKYRNIGSLAYTIGTQNTTNKTQKLKEALQELSPLIAIKKFTYNKIQTKSLIQQNTKYQGSIDLEIYGQSISDEDMQEISLKLGKKCL